MDDEASELLARINKSLQVIIALLLRSSVAPERQTSGRERIRLLNECGLSPVEIAGILRKKRTDVNAELARIRKSDTTRKKGRKP